MDRGDNWQHKPPESKTIYSSVSLACQHFLRFGNHLRDGMLTHAGK